MTPFQKTVKYCAMALAVFLVVGIVSGILGAVGLIEVFTGSEGVSDEIKVYSVSQNISALRVDVAAADFIVQNGDSFSVESNLKYLTVEEKDGVLIVAEKQRNSFGATYSDAVLVLCIPDSYLLDYAEITTGAGRLTVQELSANRISLELGAGEVNIDRIEADESAEISGGAGKVTVSGGELHNARLDMGVGELNLTAVVLGNSKLDCGVGKANICLQGSSQDYFITADKGVGRVTVDSSELADKGTYGNGENTLEIDCGVGSVEVTFKQ